MSYKTSDLHVSELVGIGPAGRSYSGGDAAGVIFLDHSCGQWVIGTPADAKRLLHDLAAAIGRAEDIRHEGPKDSILAKAVKEGWNYYCHLCRIGFLEFSGPTGSTEHVKTIHGQKFGREYDHKLAESMNYSISQP